VIEEDKNWISWSKKQLSTYTYRLVINPMIFTELCYHANSPKEVEQMVVLLGINYQDFNLESLYLTSQANKTYRLQGGQKSTPLTDFFIGAHAMSLKVPVLTRDTHRYKTYFPSVLLISPETYPNH
jgi:predicted nucleic acid-binding protein